MAEADDSAPRPRPGTGAAADSAPDAGGAAAMNRRNLLMGATLLGASAIGYARQPQPIVKPLPKDALDKLVPHRVGPWNFLTVSGLVLPPDDNSNAIYDQVLTRVYTAPGRPTVSLLLAYSSVQNGLLQLHRPEICYPASGFRLTSTERSAIVLPDKRIDVRYFSASSMSRNERVIYWTRLGNEMPLDWVSQRLAVVRANLRGEIPDGILVRVSAMYTDLGVADRALAEFIQHLSRSLKPEPRKLLFGT